jgi:chemotaxis protein CheC
MVKKILMVDDDQDILYATQMSFSDYYGDEYVFITVKSGAECFEYLNNNERPDLILLDIMMPGMNGWEVQRKLKEHNEWRKIPIVFLTAREDQFSQKVGSSVSEKYLNKPISPNELKKTIDQILHQRSSKVLSESQRDSLQEFVNIGASHAATALSKMVDQYIQIGIPDVKILPLEQTIDACDVDGICFGVFTKISDQYPTYSLLLLSEKDAFSLVDLLFDETPDESDEYLQDMYKSALQEIGNIMMSSFLNSIAELLQISVIPGPPYLAYDDPVAIMDYILIQLGKKSDEVVLFDVDLTCNGKKSFDIKMLLFPQPETKEFILEKLEMA